MERGDGRGEKKERERGDTERVSEREGWCAVGAGGVAGEWKRKERERRELGKGERAKERGRQKIREGERTERGRQRDGEEGGRGEWKKVVRSGTEERRKNVREERQRVSERWRVRERERRAGGCG